MCVKDMSIRDIKNVITITLFTFDKYHRHDSHH